MKLREVSFRGYCQTCGLFRRGHSSKKKKKLQGVEPTALIAAALEGAFQHLRFTCTASHCTAGGPGPKTTRTVRVVLCVVALYHLENRGTCQVFAQPVGHLQGRQNQEIRDVSFSSRFLFGLSSAVTGTLWHKNMDGTNLGFFKRCKKPYSF